MNWLNAIVLDTYHYYRINDTLVDGCNRNTILGV